MTLKQTATKYIPYWDFAQKIVFCFKLLHLPVPDCTVFAFKEIALDFMPWLDAFPLQCNFNPWIMIFSDRLIWRGLDILASGQGSYPAEIIGS